MYCNALGIGMWHRSLLACAAVFLALTVPVNAADRPAPEQLLRLGSEAYQRGAFPDAVVHWTDAAAAFEQAKLPREQSLVLLQLSGALAQVGRYGDGSVALHAALRLAKESLKDPWLQAHILERLGIVHFAVGDNPGATKLLDEGLILARQLKRPELTAAILNDLGNVHASSDDFAGAMAAYYEAAALAQAGAAPLLHLNVIINAATVSGLQGLRADAKSRFDDAARRAAALSDSHEKALAWLNIGLGIEALRDPVTRSAEGQPGSVQSGSRGQRKVQVVPGSQSDAASAGPPVPSEDRPFLVSEAVLIREAGEAYQAALTVAKAIADTSLEAYGWGYLGHLYEIEGRLDEALDLTRRATLAAQKLRAPESLYRWHWQTGRLLVGKQQPGDALLAYRRAVTTLQPIRAEFLAGSRTHRSSFRETTGPLFFELSDLLLRQASGTTDESIKRSLLLQAQDTVELFKAAELQDYFKDDCVAVARAHSSQLAEGDQHTAIVYPIILKDRLELLVSLGGSLKQFVVPVSAEVLTTKIRAFRMTIEDRSRKNYLAEGQQLYQWLIAPFEQDLDRAQVRTLVFVPDGPLRTIPMAPLHDGTRFLIEKYALAVTPGLTLTDPHPINRVQVKLFSAGISESVQGYPPLPNVPKELQAIAALYGGPSVLDDQFQLGKVEGALKEEPFSILHIASHGTVGRDVQSSYILAYDEKITMDRLSQLVGLYRFRDTPLELLTLSACETAAGDDRAALGLAGVAIKAGARSALATLWFIDDAATSDLIAEFYRQLQQPDRSKAVALQQAQLSILKDPTRAHPTFWAPFLLINNWL